MCRVTNMEFFENLNRDLFDCVEERERLNLRDAILTELLPIIEHTVFKFSYKSNNQPYDEDLYQSIIEHLLTEVIYKWKPSNKSTEGYYRRCIRHSAINFVNKKTRMSEIEIDTDPKDFSYWESIGTTDMAPVLVEDVFELPEDMCEGAYEEIKEILLAGSIAGGRRGLVNILKKEYDLGRVVAREIYNHALVSCREMYADEITVELQDIDTSSLFGRLSRYLTIEQAHQIIKIFGGIWIKIPEGSMK